MDLSRALKIGEVVKKINSSKYMIQILKEAPDSQIYLSTYTRDYSYKNIGVAEREDLLEYFKVRLVKNEHELKSL